MPTKYVSYLRVSTEKQGRSGLGLEAQRDAITSFLAGQDTELLAEHVEVESGKQSDRVKLGAALADCQRTGATLLIAKLDRLSRNVAFIANLMESGVSFVACDLPSTNSLTIHILAAVAEEERKMISQRTKAALARAKANGVKLGNPDNLTTEAAAEGRKLGRKARASKADSFALSLIPTITAYKAEGLSLRVVNDNYTSPPATITLPYCLVATDG